MAAVRYLNEVTLCRRMNWKIAPRMKNPHKLPELPTHEEIQRIFDNSPNLKYRAMFMLAYSAGLRISEIAHLRVTDIDSTNMRIFVKACKGNKGRYTVLSAVCLHTLRSYWRTYRPKHPEKYLFLGRCKVKPLPRLKTMDEILQEMGIRLHCSCPRLRL